MWWLALSAALAFADSPYAGASACRACHPKQAERQSASGHARSLHAATQHPLSARFVAQTVERPPFTYTWDRFAIIATDGARRETASADWAFGSGRHGVTFVTRLDARQWRELPLSFYPAANRFDITPGHEALRPGTLREAMGQLFSSAPPGFPIGRCFECHSTGPVRVSAEAVELTEHGVRCESCHGPAKEHISRAGALNAVRGRKGLDGEEVSMLCGTCHRSATGDNSNDFSDPWNVRHQPPYLEQSRCFQASAGKLSCLTCHDPHGSVSGGSMAAYNAKCSTCHATPAKACTSDCASCHMPKVPANVHLTFRNHWIGIYGADSRLIPKP